jgi:hypothetical protein
MGGSYLTGLFEERSHDRSIFHFASPVMAIQGKFHLLPRQREKMSHEMSHLLNISHLRPAFLATETELSRKMTDKDGIIC